MSPPDSSICAGLEAAHSIWDYRGFAPQRTSAALSRRVTAMARRLSRPLRLQPLRRPQRPGLATDPPNHA